MVTRTFASRNSARRALAFAAVFAALFGPTAAGAQDTDIIEHRLEPGESPYSLARDYMQSPAAYQAIVRANRISDARRLPVGAVVRLPRSLLAYEPVNLRIEAFSGDVSVNGQAAERGMAIAEGAIIRTGANGFLSLRGSDSSVITLPTRTHAELVRARVYRLDELKDIEFRILSGRGEAQVPTLRPRERYRIRTPRTVTAVRGTIFRVAFDEGADRSIVEVVEGTVGTGAGAQEALTGEGFGLVALGDSLGQEERLLPAPGIEEPGMVQTAPAVTFDIAPPEGNVAGIRTQIARDAGFVDILSETITEAGADPAFDGLEDGRYFVRARAISDSGIEGNSEIYSFRRKRLGASAEASALDDGYRFVWLAEGEGQTTYAFQLWNVERPQEMLVDETAMTRLGMVISDLDPGVYEWHVAAMQVDEEGLLQVWGPTQRLTVTD